MTHSVFTIVAHIKKGHAHLLRGVLGEIQANLEGNGILPLSPATFPEIHFACFSIFEDDTLVFEHAIDGSNDDYLERLKLVASIDEIFQHCEGYKVKTADDRLAYLKRRVKKPQLYHVGTPYRSAARIIGDRECRTALDARLDAAAAAALSDPIERPAAGMREYWNWEIVKPWIACIAGPLLLWLEVWLVGRINWGAHPRWSLLVVLDALVAGAGMLFAISLWHLTLPDLRRRVKPWIGMALATLVVCFVARSIWASHPRRAVAMVALLMGVGAYGAWTAVLKRRGARLEVIRSAGGGASPVSLWKALQATSGTYQRERPFFLLRLWNWRWWPVAYAVFFVPVWWFLPTHPHELVAGLILLFFAKAVWLTVLVGWPSGGVWTGWSAQILGFVILATVLGTLLVGSMFWLALPRPIIALFVLVALIALWAVPLPSPTVKPPVVNQAKLNDLVELEDQDAQNHMSALVELPGSGLRALSLKLFLGILNYIFYRALLPDVWQGKLFGLPTVHFAQWVLLDDRRYLFLSNYDLSWTSYLDDFGMQLTTGIQKIWGQGVFNPGTSNLGQFKDYVRTTMVPYSVWYRAYPGLTIRQIWNNENLRCELAREVGEEAMIKALRRLGAAPKILPGIVHGQIT